MSASAGGFLRLKWQAFKGGLAFPKAAEVLEM